MVVLALAQLDLQKVKRAFLRPCPFRRLAPFEPRKLRELQEAEEKRPAAFHIYAAEVGFFDGFLFQP